MTDCSVKTFRKFVYVTHTNRVTDAAHAKILIYIFLI